MKEEQEMKFILMMYGSYKQIYIVTEKVFLVLLRFPLVFNKRAIKLITCVNRKHAHLKGSYESTKYVFNAILDVIK